ncbi:MAG: DUF4145 domain-containing protein [Gammaproteobacteria bacterium]|nr:DUF4145 domain-containing protein [Gammaproteobacteria bacterium]
MKNVLSGKENMSDNPEIIKAHCNKCLGERNHYVLHEEKQNWDEEVEPRIVISSGDTFKMLKCCGCESVKLRHSSWFSEACDEHRRPYVDVNYYPPATSRPEPKWFKSLGDFFASNEQKYTSHLLSEIYTALHNDSRRLATMGARALLEHIMVSKVGDKGTFAKNLDAFHMQGFLSLKQREIIEPILEAGHAAIHRGFDPSVEGAAMPIRTWLSRTSRILTEISSLNNN